MAQEPSAQPLNVDEHERYLRPFVMLCVFGGCGVMVLFPTIAESGFLLGLLIFLMVSSPIVGAVIFHIPIYCPLLGFSAESAAYLAELKSRLPLSHADFYVRFYLDTEIPFDVVYRFRERCIKRIDRYLDRAYPADKFYRICDELDLVDVLYIAEVEFRIKFTKEEWQLIDGTFGRFFEMIHHKVLAKQVDHK